MDFSDAIAKLQQADQANARAAAQAQATQLAITQWQQQIKRRIWDNWNNPGGLRNEAGLKVLVRVDVGPDGALLNPRVAHASGNAIYDNSVLRAVSKTATVEPPPSGCPECRELEISFSPGVE